LQCKQEQLSNRSFKDVVAPNILDKKTVSFVYIWSHHPIRGLPLPIDRVPSIIHMVSANDLIFTTLIVMLRWLIIAGMMLTASHLATVTVGSVFRGH